QWDARGREDRPHGQGGEPGRSRPRAGAPHHPRRGQDGGRARRPLQRGRGLELSMLDRIRDKVEAKERLGREEGRWLLTDAPLLELGALAQEARFRLVPERRVTFVIDTNPNYTNVCITDCQFCAFYRKPGDPEAYTLSVEEVMAKVAFAAERG